jgi:hypothetical protein
MMLDVEQREALEMQRYFTTMTKAGTRCWPRRLACLLIEREDDGVAFVVEVGIVTRTYLPVATGGWHRLRYSRRVEIEPLPVAEMLDAIKASVRATVEHRIETDGRLTPASERAVRQAFRKLRPEAAKALERLITDRSAVPRLSTAALQAAAQEADAVRLALRIAEIPARETEGVDPDGEQSFVLRLAEMRASEDTTIAYDSIRFLDFDRIDSPSGVVTFEGSSVRLTVLNVNRQALERTSGADLIYINETMGSFVMVQYKTMRKQSGAKRPYAYRPDQQLEKELALMRAIKPGRSRGVPDDYRLSTGCCYLKLCRPVATLTATTELASGLYLPVDYYDILATSPDVVGERGGRVFAPDTVRRSIGNQLFLELVRGGWVGSRGEATSHLTTLVNEALDSGRTVTVAASRSRRETKA